MTGIQIDSDIYDTYIFSGDTSRITLFLKNIYERFTDLEISLEMLESRQIGRSVDENAANSTLVCQISYYFREYPKYPPCAKYCITFENIPNIHPLPIHTPCIRVLVALRLNSATTSKFYIFSQHKSQRPAKA